MKIKLNDKVVVITGGTRGIGKSMVKAFAKEGAKVIINYNISEELAKELLEDINSYNTNCMIIKADVSLPSEVMNMYKLVITKYGKIDVLINNAGICDDNLIQMMPLKQWDRVIRTNLTGTYLCCREFSKAMIRRKQGKIINIASYKGMHGCVGQANYSASKAGIIGVTRTLAQEFSQYNISVNAVCPGFVLTDLNKGNKDKLEKAKESSLLSIQHNLEDLVSLVLFLSSDYINCISGQVINVDSRI